MNAIQTVTINSTDIAVKEYNGKRVVTFKDIDACHERPEGTARKRFNDNKYRFIEGEDFFIVKPSDIQKDEIRLSEINNRGTTLVTESGYLMIVKSFTDDLSWDVQRFLVNSYFRAKEEKPKYAQQKVFNDGYEYFDKTFRGETVYTLADVEHFSNISYANIKYYVRAHFERNKDYIVVQRGELHEYKKENPKTPRARNAVCLLTPEAFNEMCELYGTKPGIAQSEKPETKQEATQQAIQTTTAAQPDYSKRITALTTLMFEMQKDLIALSERVNELESRVSC